MEDLICLNDRLLATIRAENFAGYDPFDSLNSRLLQSTPLYRNEWLRLAWLQFGKRSPINFRPLLRVPKKRNPKGIGLFIAGLLEDYRRTADGSYLQEAMMLGQWLLNQRSDLRQWEYSCWGYHFDWQARAFYVPAGKPNIITTCYIARSLYDLGLLSGELSLCEVGLDAARFITRHLFVESGQRRFYAYIPGENTFVHNASLWGAAWCAFAGKELGDQEMIDQALVVARQSAGEQAADGSWVYGAKHHHQFIDGFHTGYNLEALCLLRDALGDNEFDECIHKGYRYYVNTFFEENGTVRYYNNSVYPIDMHNFAQAVFTLLKVGAQPADVALCKNMVQRAVDLLYIPKKNQFIYQKGRWLANRINYTRWTQAWAYSSLAFYNRFMSELNHEKN